MLEEIKLWILHPKANWRYHKITRLNKRRGPGYPAYLSDESWFQELNSNMKHTRKQGPRQEKRTIRFFDTRKES